MPGNSTWNPEADRDLLVAMAMSEGGNKPAPKWEKVQVIMAEWGYDFSASALYQHFSRRIWKQIVEKRGNVSPAKPTKTVSPSTPKKRSRKEPKAVQTPLDSETDLSDTPSRKRKVSAKDRHEDDEDVTTPVKKVAK